MHRGSRWGAPGPTTPPGHRTRNPSVHRQCSNQLSHTGLGIFLLTQLVEKKVFRSKKTKSPVPRVFYQKARREVHCVRACMACVRPCAAFVCAWHARPYVVRACSHAPACQGVLRLHVACLQVCVCGARACAYLREASERIKEWERVFSNAHSQAGQIKRRFRDFETVNRHRIEQAAGGWGAGDGGMGWRVGARLEGRDRVEPAGSAVFPAALLPRMHAWCFFVPESAAS